MTDIDWKLVVSAVAMAVSLISLHFTKVNWLQSNRPIVTAFVTEHHAGSGAATFNLILANTGNRPATRIRLVAPNENIRKLVEPGVSDKHFKLIAQNFMANSEVPLLRNGEELATSFGAFVPNEPNGKWLKYGSECDVSVTYQDLEGRTYESKLPLKIYARHGFGGGVWSDPSA
jgi:hypothetical protein